MNPHRLYVDLHYDALAAQIEAEQYETFLAMPFRDVEGYQSSEVYEGLICKAAETANEGLKDTSPRRFAKPVRVDKIVPNASEITEDILEGILKCHLFIADFTLANHGVLVETGVALTLKASKNMVFLIQGSLDQVHFDLKDNRFIRYDEDGAVQKVAAALLFGAKSFEESIGPSMIEVRKRLSPEAVHLLNMYAQLRKVRPANSLHFGQVMSTETSFPNIGVYMIVLGSASSGIWNTIAPIAFAPGGTSTAGNTLASEPVLCVAIS